MAQRNLAFYTYQTDQGTDMNIKGEMNGPFSALDGHAAPDLANPTFTGINRRNHPRYAFATEPTTFRKTRGIIYTPAAFAAIALGTTVAVSVAGNTGTTNFTITDLQGEKLRRATETSRNLAPIA
jgi:hypothetical protein